VAVYNAKGHTQCIGNDGERREIFWKVGIEEIDDSCCRQALADVGRTGLDRCVDRKGFMSSHAHCMMEEGEKA
jgi:hypothetical protein